MLIEVKRDVCKEKFTLGKMYINGEFFSFVDVEFKKIMGPFYDIYKDEVGSKSDEDFALKAANKMIEIRNMYVDKEAAFPLFTKEDFKAVMGK